MNHGQTSAGSHNDLYREAGMNRSGNTGIARLLRTWEGDFFMKEEIQ